MVHSLNRQERLEKISAIVLKKGEVSLDDLCESLDVSRMTIHRDLEELESRGVLRKVRNGATAQPSSSFESNVDFRRTRATEAKERLAKYAASLVEPGDVVLLDEATTTLPMAQYLAGIDGLTIVTNFEPIIRIFTESDTTRLIGLGGEYIKRYDTFSGPICEQQVLQLRVNRYFTSTTAILGSGAYHPNSQIAQVKRAMMQSSVHRYLLADTSKFGRTALHKFAELSDFDLILTDAPLPETSADEMRYVADKITVVPQHVME